MSVALVVSVGALLEVPVVADKCGVYPGQPLRTAFPKLAEVPQADEMANRLLQVSPCSGWRFEGSALHRLH